MGRTWQVLPHLTELHETYLIQKSDRPEKGYRLADIFAGQVRIQHNVFESHQQLIGVDSSIAICVRSVLAETGAFARFWSEVLNVMRMLYSWFARGPHEQRMNVHKQTVSPVTCVTSP
jgi:hypothetical protein